MKHFLSLLAALSVTVLSAQYTPLFHDDLSFYLNFENGKTAAISNGDANAKDQYGTIKFENGLSGNAFYCGSDGGHLRYSTEDNIDFDNPGTIVVFFKGINWHQEKNFSRLMLWGIESSKGYIGVQGANDPKNICTCERPFHLMILYGKRIPDRTYELRVTQKRDCNAWNMLAFSWAGDKVYMKYNKEPMKEFAHPMGLKNDDFPFKQFSVGRHTQWKYLLDEFMVYSRKLSDDELNQIYDSLIKK